MKGRQKTKRESKKQGMNEGKGEGNKVKLSDKGRKESGK